MNEILREWFGGGVRIHKESLAALTAAQKPLMNGGGRRANHVRGPARN